MEITKDADGKFTVDGKLVGTLEDVKKAVADATVAFQSAQTTLTDAQVVEDAVVNYIEPAKPAAPADTAK